MLQNAALYLGDPSMLGSRLFARVGGFTKCDSISAHEQATGLRFTFPWGGITMNFMPPEEIPQHLEGLSGWLQHVVKDRETIIYALTRVSCARMVLGCVIEHEPDAEDEPVRFLLRLNQGLNGLLFVRDSLIDFAGGTLVGPFTAPLSNA